MITDIHTHTPSHRDAVPDPERRPNTVLRPDRVVELATSWDDYLKAMKSADKACVFGIYHRTEASGRSAGNESQENVNDRTAAFARAHSDKLIGFLSIHPDEDNSIDEIERGVHSLGLKGIKVGPNYQNFDPLSKNAFRVYETAQRLGLPILFHQGTSPTRMAPLRYAHPLVMDEIAMVFPELRIVMAHLGHPWQVDCFVVIRKHPHVYADVSAQFYRPWSQYNALRLATEWNVLDKIFLGSDFPVATTQETIDGLLAVNRVVEGTGLPRVPEEALHRIIHRDSLNLLGIPV